MLSSYEADIEKLSSSLSKLNDLSGGEITSLMSDFREFADVFEHFGVTGEKGVGDLESALQTIGKKLTDLAKTKIPHFTSAIESMFQAIANPYGNLDELNSQFNELKDLLDKSERGYEFTGSQIASLINKYSDLSKAVEVTGNGYKLEKDTIISLLNAVISKSNTSISWQIKETEQAIKNIKLRIKAYSTELSSQTTISSIAKPNMEMVTLNDIGNSTKHDVSPLKETLRKYEESLKSLYERQNEYLKMLNSLDTSSSASSSTSDFANQIDWAAQSLDILEHKVSKAQETLDNTKGYEAQIKAINQLVSEQQKLIEGYQKAGQLYDNEYNKRLNTGILAKFSLSDAVRSKIESGKVFSIEDFIDKNVPSDNKGLREQLYDAISEAVEYYNKKTDTADNAIRVRAEISESEFKKLELKIEEWEKKSDLSQNKIDFYTDSLNLQQKYSSELIKREKERYALLIQQARKEKDYTTAQKLEVEQQKTLLKLTKEQFDRINKFYNNRLGSLNSKTGKMNAAIDLAEAQGMSTGVGYYKRLNSINQYSIDYLETERDKLRSSMSAIKLYSDEWYDALQTLNDVEQQIIELNKGIAENNNLVNQIKWERFDKLLDNTQSLNDERDFLDGLIDYYEKIDEVTANLQSMALQVRHSTLQIMTPICITLTVSPLKLRVCESFSVNAAPL